MGRLTLDAINACRLPMGKCKIPIDNCPGSIVDTWQGLPTQIAILILFTYLLSVCGMACEVVEMTEQNYVATSYAIWMRLKGGVEGYHAASVDLADT